MPVLGSYPVIITVNYLNDGISLTQKHCATFDYKIRSKLNSRLKINTSPIYSEGIIRVKTVLPDNCRIILPNEIKIVSEAIKPNEKIFNVINMHPQFRCNYKIFAILETEQSQKHSTKILAGKLFTGIKPFSRGYIPSFALTISILIFLGISALLINFSSYNNLHFCATLLEYSTRLFFVSVAYLFLKEA